jgi:hypothetical protein
MTHDEEKVKSAATTALHAALCATLGVDAVTTASTDEAFSRGPITSAGRAGALHGIGETFRFFGETNIAPGARVKDWTEQLILQINQTLKAVAEAPSFVDALYAGLLGDKEDGVYPGRAGKNTIIISRPPENHRPLRLKALTVRKKPVLARKTSRPAAIASRRCR